MNRCLPLAVLLACALAVASCRTDAVDDGREEAELLAAHRRMLDAHVTGDIAALVQDVGVEFVSVFGGEVRHSSRDEQRATLQRLFAGLRFTHYDDVEPPEVRVSSDGRLGWVVARTRARGWRDADGGEEVPVEYVTAWVVLYEKRGGRWMRVGAATSIR